MTRKKMLPLSILLPIVLSVLSVNMIGVSAVVSSPYIAVFPDSIVDTGYGLGTNFTVSICTDYVGTSEWENYIWGYQFALSYNPSVINGVEVVNGDLIVGGSTNFLPGPFDNVAGELSLTVGVFEEGGEVTSGPGTLASVNFTVVGYGASNITIDSAPLDRQSKLIGWNWLLYPYCDYDIINAAEHPDQIQHGYFQNVADLTHDVAVTSVTPASTTVLVDTSVDITVDVKNEGNINEAFDVTAYANATLIETQTVTYLGSHNLTTTLTFTWNTTGVPLGPYTINATASTVPGETDTVDNTRVSAQPVTVTGPMYIPEAVITIVSEDFDYYINETAIFSGALSSDDDGGTIVTYEWDFDDGTTATRDYPIVEHEWTTTPEYYDVSLVVTDSQGQVSDPAIVTIKIEEDPVIPPDYYADLIKWKAKSEARSWDESMDPGTEKEDMWTGNGTQTTFIATAIPIVEDSEQVYVNQILMTKSVNYTIDYDTGQITFAFVPDLGVEIEATYLSSAPGPGEEIKATYLWVTKTVTLTALASNMGLNPVNVTVSYTIIYYQTGLDAGPVITENRTLDADGLQVEITTDFDPYDYGYTGEKLELTVEVTLTYDSTGDGTPDTEGSDTKFRLTVKP